MTDGKELQGIGRMIELRQHEFPIFDNGEWTASTRHGMIWQIFPSEKMNKDGSLYKEALEAVKEIVKTGKPLVGGWR